MKNVCKEHGILGGRRKVKLALKKLLGLENFSLSETEVMSRIQRAYISNKKEIEFTDKNQRVVIKLSDCASGVTDWHMDVDSDG